MDRERIIGASSKWGDIKDIFREMGLMVSRKNDVNEHVSHGIMVIYRDEGLFLQLDSSYEYKCLLHGQYTGVKLYHYLSLLTEEERELLTIHPFLQWRKIYPVKNMPGYLYRKLRRLQRNLPKLYRLIPSQVDKFNRATDCIIHNDTFSIPKGRACNDEDSISAAIRELHEETGILVDRTDLSAPYIDRYTGTDGNVYTTFIYAVFLHERPKIRLGKEFKDYVWLSAHEHVLLSRQTRILHTFLSHVNKRNDATGKFNMCIMQEFHTQLPSKETACSRLPATQMSFETMSSDMYSTA